MKALIRRHPIASYFVITFAISWSLAFLIASPALLSGRTIPYLDAVLPAQEAGWFAAYAAALWLVVLGVAKACGRRLVRQQAPMPMLSENEGTRVPVVHSH